MCHVYMRKRAPLIKRIHKSVLVVIGDFLHLCNWYAIGEFPYKDTVRKSTVLPHADMKGIT